MKYLISTFFLLLSEVTQSQKIIDPISTESLKLETYLNNSPIATATGFVVLSKNKHYLITNWHVVSGVDLYQNNKIIDPQGRVPNTLRIWHNGTELGSWKQVAEPLFINGNKRWYEISFGNQIADVVALPLSNVPNDIKLYPFNIDLDKTDMIPTVAMPTSIVGFPNGESAAGLFPIWKTGHIASDPDTDYKNLPMFLIDATTRSGMSGSPVILRLTGGYATRSGGYSMAQAGASTLFLGIYAGHMVVNEVGIVWKPIVLRNLLERIN